MRHTLLELLPVKVDFFLGFFGRQAVHSLPGLGELTLDVLVVLAPRDYMQTDRVLFELAFLRSVLH